MLRYFCLVILVYCCLSCVPTEQPEMTTMVNERFSLQDFEDDYNSLKAVTDSIVPITTRTDSVVHHFSVLITPERNTAVYITKQQMNVVFKPMQYHDKPYLIPQSITVNGEGDGTTMKMDIKPIVLAIIEKNNELEITMRYKTRLRQISNESSIKLDGDAVVISTWGGAAFSGRLELTYYCSADKVTVVTDQDYFMDIVNRGNKILQDVYEVNYTIQATISSIVEKN